MIVKESVKGLDEKGVGRTPGPRRAGVLARGAVRWLVFASSLGTTVLHASSDIPPEQLVRQLREARIAISRGLGDKGVQILRQAIADNPKEILPVLALTAYFRRNKGSAEETEKLRLLLRHRLTDPESPLPQASVREIVDDPDIGKDELALMKTAAETRLGAAPDDIAYLDALARIQDRLNDREGARLTLEKILELRPQERVMWQIFYLDWSLEHWDSAVERLHMIRAKSGDDLWLRVNLLAALGEAGRYEEILQESEPLKSSTAFRTQSVPPLLHAAWSLHDAGKKEEAQRAFRKVLEIDPSNAEARDAQLYLYSTGREQAALETARDAAWLEQNDPYKLEEEGVSRLSAHDPAGAYELLKRAAEKLRDSETAWFNLGLAALKLERWEEARAAMAKSAAIKPSFPNAHLNLGAALQKLGRCMEAIEELNKALTLRPDLVQAHGYLYYCYSATGDKQKAAHHLKLSKQGG